MYSRCKGPYFLKRLSKALRASEGFVVAPLVPLPPLPPLPLLPLPPESRVSRSMDTRAVKNLHVLRKFFLVIRPGMASVHSNLAAVSKWRQFLHDRRSGLHLGQWLSYVISTGGGTMAPQSAQRRTS